MPGVSYQREVEFTPHGPVVLDVVTAPRPDGTLYTLAPALSNNAIVATEKLTDMEKELSTNATVVGVNGDFFVANPGKPTGSLMRGGALERRPLAPARASASAPTARSPSRRFVRRHVARTGQRRQLDLNAAPVKGHTTLYTSAWGPETPAERASSSTCCRRSRRSSRIASARGVVSQVRDQGRCRSRRAAPCSSSRGNQAPHLSADAPVGHDDRDAADVDAELERDASAIGGGPLLVSAGKPVFRAGESFGDPVLNRRSARSAVAQLSDGRILLVTVEGGGSAYSAGMTNYELAVALVRLGAKTAMGLGSGPSAAMAFDGTLLTPRDRRTADRRRTLSLLQRRVRGAAGVDTLSPNGDGVDDVQTFTYKLVRPSKSRRALPDPAMQRSDSRGQRGSGRPHAAVGRCRRCGGELEVLRHRHRRSRAHDERRPAIRAQPDARRASGDAERNGDRGLVPACTSPRA